jgi:hypothetical protein
MAGEFKAPAAEKAVSARENGPCFSWLSVLFASAVEFSFLKT